MRSRTARTSLGSGTSTSSRCSTGSNALSRPVTGRRSSRCAASTRASTPRESTSSHRSNARSTTAWRRRLRAASSSCCRPTRRCWRCASSSPNAGTCGSTGSGQREAGSVPALPPGGHAAPARIVARADERVCAESVPTPGSEMKIRVAHLYPEYLNIYADRGQDREQALVAVDLAARGEQVRHAVERGAAALAVCGGYQLFGRYYRDRGGVELPGAGLLPLHTIAGERRMIGDVLLDCAWARRTLAGFENHAGRTILDPEAEPLGRVVSGFGNDGASGFEGCRVGRAIGTYLHGPLLPRNPWFADWVLAQALAHATGGEAQELAPLPDELEQDAHDVASRRARERGGRF